MEQVIYSYPFTTVDVSPFARIYMRMKDSAWYVEHNGEVLKVRLHPTRFEPCDMTVQELDAGLLLRSIEDTLLKVSQLDD